MPNVNISVSLNTAANPPVVLSKRKQDADAGDTIRWQKHDNNDRFDITSLSPTGSDEAFSDATTGGNGQWLKSTFQPSGTGEYEYTLTVTKDGVSCTTTETVARVATTDGKEDGLVERRPVIRN